MYFISKSALFALCYSPTGCMSLSLDSMRLFFSVGDYLELLQDNVSKSVLSNTVKTSTGVDKKTAPENVKNA